MDLVVLGKLPYLESSKSICIDTSFGLIFLGLDSARILADSGVNSSYSCIGEASVDFSFSSLN